MTTRIINTEAPRTIRAKIHQDALSRVPAFFNATTKEMLNELFQNARRSGATQVDITTESASVLTVSDDGEGIADPETILSSGQSGWDNQAAVNEHPAGMGMYALARCVQVRISSKQAGQPGWQVTLEPDHFVGKKTASIEPLPEALIEEHGTRVTLNTGADPERSVQGAARYYPLPVTMDGMRMHQEDFLAHAVHTEEWEGVRIGVYNRYSKAEMNFHGVVVEHPNLPRSGSITDHWTAQADVVDCPHLELTLPARKEVVETPFMKRLRTACLRTIFRAMADSESPVDVPKRVQDEAGRLGIRIPDARPLLEPWEPEDARTDRFSRNTPQREEAGPDTVTVPRWLPAPDQQALARAAKLNRAEGRLMRPNRELEGYGWYNRLTQANHLEITVHDQGEEHKISEIREKKQGLENQRPDRIVITLEREKKNRQDETVLTLPTDLAFLNQDEEYVEDNIPLVTKDSALEPPELAEILLQAFLDPSDDPDADSHETQQYHAELAYEKTANGVLMSSEDAARQSMEKALQEHVVQEVPQGKTATVIMTKGRLRGIEIKDTE